MKKIGRFTLALIVSPCILVVYICLPIIIFICWCFDCEDFTFKTANEWINNDFGWWFKCITMRNL